MIRCKDCKWQERTKYKGDSVCLNSVNEGISPDLQAVILAPDDFGCTHAERRDGLKECCATCRHIMNNACLQGYHCTGNIVLEKMLCPEWQPREEER